MWRGISLANKCLLLFGGAVVLILVAALSLAWVRMNGVAERAEIDVCTQTANAWEFRNRAVVESREWLTADPPMSWEFEGSRVTLLAATDAAELARTDRFLRSAVDAFGSGASTRELLTAEWRGLTRITRVYRLARPARVTVAPTAAHAAPDPASPPAPRTQNAGIILLERTSELVGQRLVFNTVYVIIAALVALALAILVFYLITNRLILEPVRELRATAEQVREGNLGVRSDIATGDEFQELAETFNAMLETLQGAQNQLRSLNTSLDTKVNELAERNLALYEANKLKGEFLASVTHELRTPLNSIIGFAELLQEIADREAAAGDDSTRLAKRRRYLDNIRASSRSLLELINGLLEMAKVEAGKMELHVEPIDIAATCEALGAMMRPVAEKNAVELRVEVPADPPIVHTDRGKLQQIVFNLLSNAIKFSTDDAHDPASHLASQTPHPEPRRGLIVLRAEGLVDRGASATPSNHLPTLPHKSETNSDNPYPPTRPAIPPSATDDPSPAPPDATLPAPGQGGGVGAKLDRVRISVLDNGPGIAKADQERIFDKFVQLDSGHTRRHSGTGLGLAICKELTHMLQGELNVESELGRGSMFSLILPIHMNRDRANEMRMELEFRTALSPRAGS